MARTTRDTTKCKRCGSEMVAWRTSKKSGKYYLVEVFIIDGEPTSDYRDFHSGYCNDPVKHEIKQSEIYASERVEDEHARDEDPPVEHWLKLHDMAKRNEALARETITGLLAEIARGCEKRRMDLLQAEVKFLFAALGEPLANEDDED